jgi:hypothetical protein
MHLDNSFLADGPKVGHCGGMNELEWRKDGNSRGNIFAMVIVSESNDAPANELALASDLTLMATPWQTCLRIPAGS